MADLPLHPPRWRAALAEDGAALIEATVADPTAVVAACPGWTTASLLGHVAGLHRFVAGILAGHGEPPSQPAAIGAETSATAARALDGLLSALQGVGEDDPAWNWSPQPDTARFWFRRMCQETLVHRVDAELALGRVPQVDRVLAADGVDELLTLFLPRVFRRAGGFTRLLGTLMVTVTDTDAGPWQVEITDADVVVRTAAGTAGALDGTGEVAVPDLQLAAPAADLLLYLWGRTGPESVGADPAHPMVVGLAQEFLP